MNVIVEFKDKSEEGVSDITSVTVGRGSIVCQRENTETGMSEMPTLFPTHEVHSVTVFPHGDDQ